MLSRNILLTVAAGLLSVTPVLAQQPKPAQTVASVPRDTTHVTKRAHKRSTKPTPSMKADAKAEQKPTPTAHKPAKHGTKKSAKTTPDSTKKP